MTACTWMVSDASDWPGQRARDPQSTADAPSGKTTPWPPVARRFLAVHLGQQLAVLPPSAQQGLQLLLASMKRRKALPTSGDAYLLVVAAHGQVAGGGHLAGDAPQAAGRLALFLDQTQVDGVLLRAGSSSSSRACMCTWRLSAMASITAASCASSAGARPGRAHRSVAHPLVVFLSSTRAPSIVKSCCSSSGSGSPWPTGR